MSDVDLELRLEARAAALRSSTVGAEPEERTEILVLRVGAERLGIPLDQAEAVISDVTVTPLPHLHAPWVGVVHLRGRLVAVADLGVLVGAATTSVRHVVVLAADDRCALGLELPPLAARVRPDELAATAREGTAIARALRGTAPDGTALLDSDALLELLRGRVPMPRKE